MYFRKKSLMKKLFPLLAFSLLGISLQVDAQGVYAGYNKDYYHLVERYEIKNSRVSETFFTTGGNIRRQDIAKYFDDYTQNLNAKTKLSKRDSFNINYLLADNWEWSRNPDQVSKPIWKIKKSFLKHFYVRSNAFLSHETKNKLFEVQFNPVFYGLVGYEKGYGIQYINTRAFEARGMIGRRLGFYTFLSENQSRLPSYMGALEKNWNALPGENFYKDYKGNGSYDYFQFRGYLTFSAIKDVLQFQFGHDNHRIGTGYRSLLLENNAPPMLFFKTSVKVWKFNYQWMISQGINNSSKIAYGGFDKKYFSWHHLSVNIGKRFNLGVFEAITNGASGADAKFELNYLNPVIIYRSVEAHIGNKHSSILGLDFKVNFARHFQIYGQLAVSELNFQELKKRNGWFGNQQSVQIGAKYIDAFTVKNLDLQAEFNYVRPFMYSDRIPESAYTHYNQPLAHALGANVMELVGIIRYQPHKRIHINLESFYAIRGLDPNTGDNYGSNLLLSYEDRTQDYGNYIGTGAKTRVLYGNLGATYMFRHNFFIDFNMIYRNAKSSVPPLSTSSLLATLSVRMNIGKRFTAY